MGGGTALDGQNEQLAANLAAYEGIYSFEVVVRELFISRVEAANLPWRRCLPGDVLEKFKNGRLYERNRPWLDFCDHHPLYYVDFPDLPKIANLNWSLWSDRLANREEFERMILAISPIRNSVAHNRGVSAHMMDVLRIERRKLLELLGSALVSDLLGRATQARALPIRLGELATEFDTAWRQMQLCEAPVALEHWCVTAAAWWFDDDYFATDLNPVRSFGAFAETYNDLAVGRGYGSGVQQWLLDNAVGAANSAANEVLMRLAGA